MWPSLHSVVVSCYQILVPIKRDYNMTFRTLLGSTRKPNSSFCLVCWPDEENKLSVVPSKKIASPSPEDLAPGTFCKIKGFETHLCKIVALGTEADMKKKMGEMDLSDEARAPPKKKARLEATTKEKSKKRGKENRTPSRQKKGAKKKGSIILVGAHMAKDVKNSSPVQTENSSAQPPKPTTQTENATTPASPTHPLGDHTDSSAQPQTAAVFNSSLDDSFASIASLPPPLSGQTSLSPYENISVHQSGTIDPGKST